MPMNPELSSAPLAKATRGAGPDQRSGWTDASDTVEQARDNLQEALELFFECAPEKEVAQRLSAEVFVTQVEVAIG